mmetsp:Transcript_30882/g.73551  ORF Transcript_30882/g.73551 Transcript_30882/m.73551 type:complete len:450 (-) Transcript_30882:76-1425(-)
MISRKSVGLSPTGFVKTCSRTPWSSLSARSPSSCTDGGFREAHQFRFWFRFSSSPGGTLTAKQPRAIEQFLRPRYLDLLVLLGRKRVADFFGEFRVVSVRGTRHEIKATGCASHRTDRAEYVVCLQCKVLKSGSLILLQIRLDLTLAFGPKGRLVHRHEDKLAVVGQNHAVEAAVDRPDVLGCEFCELVETCYLLHVVDLLQEVVHVADGVVEPVEAEARGPLGRRLGLVPCYPRALERAPNKAQDDVPVKLDLAQLLRRPGLGVLDGCRREDAPRAVGRGDPPRLRRVGDAQPDGADGEPVLPDKLPVAAGVEPRHGGRPSGLRAGRRVGAGEDKDELARPQRVAGVARVAGALVGARGEGHPEAMAKPLVRVGCISTPEFDVMETLDVKLVTLWVYTLKVFASHELPPLCFDGNVGERFVVGVAFPHNETKPFFSDIFNSKKFSKGK